MRTGVSQTKGKAMSEPNSKFARRSDREFKENAVALVLKGRGQGEVPNGVNDGADDVASESLVLRDQTERLLIDLGVRTAKEGVYRSLDMGFSDGLRLSGLLSRANRATEDAKEANRARREKRKPDFKAR